ncbi:hypothetical protein Nepgr_000299 [Nepenthes gracilis]|uniref:Uncharacterized protein n=1 Tax=Nepenthes gracilis TaxID=150966 RepID=A0AAD3RWL1_NEPGR|nr:hypothetical protein Nepgr_000299 [Nepenthes gracilis]
MFDAIFGCYVFSENVSEHLKWKWPSDREITEALQFPAVSHVFIEFSCNSVSLATAFLEMLPRPIFCSSVGLLQWQYWSVFALP